MPENATEKRIVSPVISEATQKQRAASNPLVSSWVGASAGSGKTKVLTDRILRLLLPRENGEPATKPDKILAITFTKAGANEMALRLSARLSRWAVMGDEDLFRDMKDNLLGRDPTGEELREARKLFARVVDTPGGLKIMTIHSFCQSILGRFPIEAGLPPHFRPLEEEQARELLDQAKRAILSHAGKDAYTPLSQAVAQISTVMNETQFSDVIAKLVSERHQMQQVLDRTFGIDGFYTTLCTELGISPGHTTENLFVSFAMQGSERDLRDACAYLANGGTSDQKKAQDIQNFWDNDPDKRQSLYPAYRKSFLTDKGTVLKTLATKAVLQNAPHIESVLLDEAERLLRYEEERKAIVCASITRDLFLVGQAVLDKYRFLKESLGVLDFDDLILKTLSLLKGECSNLRGEKVAAWVLYKLDEGLDHILVDEAQDTNPEQWEIVRLIAAEFFEGQGARDISRTVFVVGDEKQSIFSFQRAAPEKFGQMRGWFQKKIRESGKSFEPVDINTSFRSVQAVLDVVDKVYDRKAAMLGLSSEYLDHIAKRQGQAGLVEFWPVYRTRGTAEDDTDGQLSLGGWFMPDQIVEAQSGSSQMAAKIGDTIQDWLRTGEQLESYGRPIQPGDIMILVKSRSAIVGQLVRALKKRGVPVSGVDRMRLTEQLAVQDLCVAAAFALLPEDDLALATFLKSPFIGMNEEQLFALAHDRPQSLWKRLQEIGDSETVAWLSSLIARAGFEHPYEFFSRLVQEPCPADAVSGLSAIRKRLGIDALDPLDEFLNSTIAYESMHVAGLQAFLKSHTDSSSDIKRELEESGGAVRIMTVHGSKGLQAPIVFMPDTVHTKSKTDPVLWPHKTGHSVPYYIPQKESIPGRIQDALSEMDRKAEEEYRRLLYVAMTRAEERLYVGGYSGKRQPGTRHWYDDIRSAFTRLEGVVEIPSGLADENGTDIPVLRLSTQRTAAPDKVAATTPTGETRVRNVTLPAWARRKAPDEPFPPKPLVPSRPSEAEPAAASPLIGGQDYRFKRGNITHKLLQLLPELPSGQREAAAEQFLARPSLSLPPALQSDIAAEIFAILHDPTFGDIFSEDSIAEIPVTGYVDGQLVSGQIDRMLIRPDEILIVDYKTNRPPPTDVEAIPAIYRRQMKAYAEIIRRIYPGRTVRCALLWTDGARLMPVPV